jgi:hypothetical protein
VILRSPLALRLKSQVKEDQKAAQWTFYRLRRPPKSASGELV